MSRMASTLVERAAHALQFVEIDYVAPNFRKRLIEKVFEYYEIVKFGSIAINLRFAHESYGKHLG